MQRKIRNIVIVGGGSAGWMAAAAFARAMAGTDFSIDLVESEEIGTVGVGEATIPSILEFNRTVGLDEVEFIRATQASFKLGIEFVDWRRQGHAYMHPFGFYGVQMEGIYFHHFWLRYCAQGGPLPYDAFCSNIIAARAGKFGRPLPADRSPVPHLAYAYHFDAGLYAAFLRKFSEALGVKRHEGKVVDVQLRATDGFIESIKLQDGRVLAGDLFIDCTGFRGLLIEQTLQAGYEDWSEFLPCDRAMAVPCERIAATTPYTRSTAREAGWQWRIPLQHRTGNGYVYCSQFMSDDEAAGLLLTRLDGKALNSPRPLRFVTGRRKEVWKKNCVALGLASGFLEPLESTSIHLVLASIQRLLFMFPGDGFDQATIDKFNALCRIETEEIRDFLVLHYIATERGDTAFWRHCQAIRKPDTLVQKLAMFEHSANIVIGPSELFREPSWFAVLMGQGPHPKSYHPFANNISDAELARRFALMSSDVEKRVQTYPMHDEFIRTHCAAPPMPGRAA